MKRSFTASFGFLAILFLGFIGAAPADQPTTEIRIGMVRTLFNDVPQPLVQLLSTPFTTIMKECTGLNGKVIFGGDPYDLGRDLHEGKVDFAVFHGIEFAWAKQKYPELKPLMAVINKSPSLSANLVVCDSCTASCFADFKDKDVALPLRSRQHVCLFLENGCANAKPESFFHEILKPSNVEVALDDLLAGKGNAAIIDDLGLETYKQTKPGCYARLKIIKKSEDFPCAAVVYKEGSVSDATLKKFRDGMFNANKSERGRDMMSLWKITEFAPIPANYSQTLAEILKSYPPPTVSTSVSRN